MGLSHGFEDYWCFLNFCWFGLCVPFCKALHAWGRWASWAGCSQLLPPFPTGFREHPPMCSCLQRWCVSAESRSVAGKPCRSQGTGWLPGTS